MADRWLDIIGIGEDAGDGMAGLSDASRAAIAAAEVVFGGPRHLALANVDDRGRAWSVPFDVAPVLALRGRRIVVLASGDPFWFGVGGTLAAHVDADEWRVTPATSTFSWAAARLGWRIEAMHCLGLHAAPFEIALPHLHPGARLVCLLRSGSTVAEFAAWLTGRGFGASALWVMEALGGPRECIRSTRAHSFDLTDVGSPVAVAIEVSGAPGLPRSAGLADESFVHDGQITKSAIRAMTLAALAPRPGAHLWDIGAGSGSVSVEWCLAGGRATAIEQQSARADNVRANARAFGVGDRLSVIDGLATEVIDGLSSPDAVFVGGGFDRRLFELLQVRAGGCRLVVNAVTLETEALLLDLHATHGGDLLRIELARAAPLGRSRGWVPARPIVQWCGTLQSTAEDAHP